MKSDNSEVIQRGSLVSLKYKMRVILPDGSFESKEPEGFIEFVYGIEKQSPGLEKAILGAKKGDRFQIHIPASELYGERDDALIKEIPKKGLIKQRVKVGQYYRQIKNAALISFKVLEIRSNTILADFNSPMAGVSALMDVKVINVKKASEEQIALAKEAEQKRKIGCE